MYLMKPGLRLSRSVLFTFILTAWLPLVQASPAHPTIEKPGDEKLCATLTPGAIPVTSYWDDGTLRSAGCTIGEQATGPYTAWHRNGHKSVQGHFQNGKLHGVWTRWREDGTIIDKGAWREGKPNGRWQLFDDQGHKKEEGVYRGGCRVGQWQHYAADGSYKVVAASTDENCEQQDWQVSTKPWSITPSLGFSVLEYERLTRKHHMAALTVKAVFAFRLPNSFDVSVNGYGTALPLATEYQYDPPTKVRYLGANLRVGYTLPWPSSPWALSIATGLSYSRMMVTDNRFGYGNLLYPQIYPAIRYAGFLGGAWSAYIKYVPLDSDFFKLITDKREIAGGISYERAFILRRNTILSLDVSDLTVQPANTKTPMMSRSLSFGIGFRL